MLNHFRPTAGSYGVQLVTLTKEVATLTANVTNTKSIGGLVRPARIHSIVVSTRTVPVDADGTLVTTVKKRDKSAAANVTLTDGTLNLETLVANEAQAITLASTLTDDQRTLDAGDTLFVEIVSNSAAIDTQPADLTFVAILEVLK